MGPHATIKRDGSATAMRSELQLSPTESTDQVEWSSPTYIRARSRPSNLQSNVRSNPSFFLSAAASPRPFRAPGSASGSSTGGASPRHPQLLSRVRSQSTRSTQTTTADAVGEGSGASVVLGGYGDVRHMSITTVEMLMSALEHRWHELQNGGDSDNTTAKTDIARTRLHQPREAISRTEPSQEPTKPVAKRKIHKSVVDTSGSQTEQPPLDAAAPHTEEPPRPLVRSRSYEALFQLEQILEARHQQLMRDGTLDESSSTSLQGCSGSDLKEEIQKLQQSIRQETSRLRC